MARAWHTASPAESVDIGETCADGCDQRTRYDRRLRVEWRLHASRLWARCAFLGLVGTNAILAVPGPGWSAGVPGSPDDAAKTAPVPSAEVVFETPRRFAVVVESPTPRQRLYGVGDILLAPKGDSGEYQVMQIEERRLQLGDVKTRKAIWIAVGGVVPGRTGRRVAGTPVLRTVEYRYVPTDESLDAEPRVVELREGHASLEVDVPATASASPPIRATGRATSLPSLESAEARERLERTLLGRVRVKPTGDDSYEISAADLNAALERGVQLAAEAWPKVWPSAPSRHGVSLHVESPIADGTLGPRGFRVTSPNLAERGGVQVGDVIVGVNGRPVNSFADVYRAYRQMRRDPSLSVIQLDLERQGQHLTKTYRIR